MDSKLWTHFGIGSGIDTIKCYYMHTMCFGNQTGLVKILIIFKFMLQWWCEGALFSGVGVIGLVVNVLSVGILATKELRKHTFNQVLNI